MIDLPSPQRSYLSDDRLEDTLRAFFRSEMPDPWPVLKAPELPRYPQPVVRPWWKRTGRLALAASVGLLLIGYLALARGFPRSHETRSHIDGANIGAVPSVHPRKGVGPPPKNLIRMQTPDGRPVVIEEMKGRDGWFLKAQFAGEPKENR